MNPTKKQIEEYNKKQRKEHKKTLSEFKKTITFEMFLELKEKNEMINKFSLGEFILSDYAKGQKVLLDLIFKNNGKTKNIC